MPKYSVQVSGEFATTFDVVADDEEEAEVRALIDFTVDKNLYAIPRDVEIKHTYEEEASDV